MVTRTVMFAVFLGASLVAQAPARAEEQILPPSAGSFPVPWWFLPAWV